MIASSGNMQHVTPIKTESIRFNRKNAKIETPNAFHKQTTQKQSERSKYFFEACRTAPQNNDMLEDKIE